MFTIQTCKQVLFLILHAVSLLVGGICSSSHNFIFFWVKHAQLGTVSSFSGCPRPPQGKYVQNILFKWKFLKWQV